MSESETVVRSGGISFCGLLAVLFIGLKLTGHIDWSWLWVLSPLWIPWCLLLSILGVGLLISCFVYLVCWLIDKVKSKKSE